MGIKNEEPNTDKSTFDLREIARLDSYGGFIFGSLSPDVPSLADWLGEAKPWIDLMVAQSTEGLEVIPGSSTYAIDGNWKFQAENAVDGYHVSTVHRVFANTIAAREGKGEYTGIKKTEAGRMAGGVPTGCYDLGNGHMAVWAQHTTPEVRPIWEQKERLEKDLTPAQVDWILTKGRNLYIFPNVMLMDNPSTQIRTDGRIGLLRRPEGRKRYGPGGTSSEVRGFLPDRGHGNVRRSRRAGRHPGRLTRHRCKVERIHARHGQYHLRARQGGGRARL